MPFGGAPATPSGASFARNITKLAPVAAVGEMRCAVVAFTLHLILNTVRYVHDCGNLSESFRGGCLELSQRIPSCMHVTPTDCEPWISPAWLTSPHSALRGDQGVVPPVCASCEAWQICPFPDMPFRLHEYKHILVPSMCFSLH